MLLFSLINVDKGLPLYDLNVSLFVVEPLGGY